MAEVMRLADDIDGSDAAERITFGFRGKVYSIDLSEANAEKLDGQMHYWIEHARSEGMMPHVKTAGARTAGARTARSSPSTSPMDDWWVDKPEATQEERGRLKDARRRIREWAQTTGHYPDLGLRGVIPKAVARAYTEAHAGPMPLAKHRAPEPASTEEEAHDAPEPVAAPPTSRRSVKRAAR